MCHAAFMFSGVPTSIRECGCRGQRRRDAELLARQRRQSSCGVARKMLGPHVALPPSDARRREKRSPRTGVNDISPRPVRQVVSRNVTRNSRPSELAAPAAPRESLRRTPLVSHPLQGRRRASLSPAASEGRLGPAFAAVSYSDGWACFVP